MSSKYEAVIGLEIHAQLLTKSKLFCGCSTEFGSEPNANTCPVCLGLPGALPVLNKQAVAFAIKAALATGCKLNPDLKNKGYQSVFSRKNYFYPDLPKGYQISQFDKPLAVGGKLAIEHGEAFRDIGIHRIHMEEDAGKLLHDSLGQAANESLVDFNRAGVPLIEIVSEPDIRTPEEASDYLKRWRQLLRFLEICDGNLEQGSMRCDANISVRLKGETKLNTKAEVKNINSFRFVQKAVAYEIERQIAAYENGETIQQETRLWDSNKGITKVMRSKEEAHDYRYFPEPDLKPLRFEQPWVDEIKATIPELPKDKVERFEREYDLPFYDANFLTQETETADYFEETARLGKKAKDTSKRFKAIANWMMGDITKALKEKNSSFSASKLSPTLLSQLLDLIESGELSGKMAKSVFEKVLESGEEPKKIMANEGMAQISDEGALKTMIAGVLSRCPKEVEDYRGGRTKLFGFFVGQVMKESRGQANPKLVNDILKQELDG